LRSLIVTLVLLVAPAWSSPQSWESRPIEDRMTNTPRGVIHLLKSEPQSFEFPYNAPQPAGLGIRHFGTNAISEELKRAAHIQDEILLIWTSPGAPPILHSHGVRISVDGIMLGVGQRYESLQPDTGSHSMAILRVHASDIIRIANARVVKIEVGFFQVGTRVFTFQTTPPLANLPPFAATKAALEAAQ